MDEPRSVSLKKYIRYIQSQETVSCCTASATLLAAEMILESTGNSNMFSRLFLYYMTRKNHDRLGQRGAELKDALEALKMHGSPPEKFWPFAINRAEKPPHKQAIDEAVYHRVHSYIKISPDEYKYYLKNETPIIVGMRTGRLFWKLQGSLETQNYKPINDYDNIVSRGHAITVIGYDDDLNGGSWIIANSIGPKWGCQGYAAIPYICNIDMCESYVITNFAGIYAGKKISEN